MSLEVKGISCVYCKSYLFDEDDVVYCPVCGAPHHRDCYNKIGHCALETLHGTPDEYSRDIIKDEPAKDSEPIKNTNVKKCEMCNEEYDNSLNRCPKCGTPDLKRMGNFPQFDFLGGIPEDFDIGDGVTAKEAKNFVMTNTHRYIPKFATLSKQNKFSWNWMAFLFPAGWMLSRKMYKGGIIAGIFTIISTLLSYPLSLEFYNLGLMNNGYNAEAINSIAANFSNIGVAVMILALVGAVCDLSVRLVSALMGDYMYKNYTIGTIKIINKENEDKVDAFRKKGGVNMLMFLVALMLIQYIPAIITMFIK